MANKSTIPYGINITASDAQGAINEAYKDRAGVNTWKKLLGQAGAEYTAQANALQENYGEAIGEAYKSSLKKQENIDRLGLATGSRDELLSENRQLLMEAYDNYFKNFASGMQTIGTEYGQNISAIEQALNDEAGNISKLLSRLYEYSKNELADTSRDNTILDPITGDTRIEKTNIYRALREGGLAEGFFDVNGEDWSLKDWQDIQDIMFDENGNLTPDGVNFYMSLMNLEDTQGYKHSDESSVRSFGNWLYDTDSDLYDWYNAADPYNYTEDGRRSGTIRRLLGKSSTDYTNRISGDASRQANAPSREHFVNDMSRASTQIDASVAEIDKLISTTIGADVDTTELDSIVKQFKADDINIDEQTFRELLDKARNAAGKKVYDPAVISAAYRQNFETGKMSDNASKDIMTRIDKIVKNVANLNSASSDYARLYGERMSDNENYNNYQQGIEKLNTWYAEHQGKQLSMKDVDNVKGILNNMQKAANKLQTETGIESKKVAGESYGTNFWDNAKTGSENIGEAIRQTGNFDRTNTLVKDTVNEAYNTISGDGMTITLNDANKEENAHKRDLVITYNDGTKFTVDRRTGVGKGSSGWTEETGTVRTELNGRYANSLLAVYNDRVYLQYEKGHWIDVYPKVTKDKGSEQSRKDQFEILKVIAYKMMLENNMEISTNGTTKEIWADNGKIRKTPQG